jgi:Holliday junction resolvasome RuvABC endonuclease subunit
MAEPFRSRNTGEAMSVGALYGIVRAECWRRNIVVKLQPEPTVRKEMLGKGRAPTDEMKALALAWCRANAIETRDHNIADACVLWEWTRRELLKQRKAA